MNEDYEQGRRALRSLLCLSSITLLALVSELSTENTAFLNDIVHGALYGKARQFQNTGSQLACICPARSEHTRLSSSTGEAIIDDEELRNTGASKAGCEDANLHTSVDVRADTELNTQTRSNDVGEATTTPNSIVTPLESTPELVERDTLDSGPNPRDKDEVFERRLVTCVGAVRTSVGELFKACNLSHEKLAAWVKTDASLVVGEPTDHRLQDLQNSCDSKTALIRHALCQVKLALQLHFFEISRGQSRLQKAVLALDHVHHSRGRTSEFLISNGYADREHSKIKTALTNGIKSLALHCLFPDLQLLTLAVMLARPNLRLPYDPILAVVRSVYEILKLEEEYQAHARVSRIIEEELGCFKDEHGWLAAACAQYGDCDPDIVCSRTSWMSDDAVNNLGSSEFEKIIKYLLCRATKIRQQQKQSSDGVEIVDGFHARSTPPESTLTVRQQGEYTEHNSRQASSSEPDVSEHAFAPNYHNRSMRGLHEAGAQGPGLSADSSSGQLVLSLGVQTTDCVLESEVADADIPCLTDVRGRIFTDFRDTGLRPSARVQAAHDHEAGFDFTTSPEHLLHGCTTSVLTTTQTSPVDSAFPPYRPSFSSHCRKRRSEMNHGGQKRTRFIERVNSDCETTEAFEDSDSLSSVAGCASTTTLHNVQPNKDRDPPCFGTSVRGSARMLTDTLVSDALLPIPEIIFTESAFPDSRVLQDTHHKRVGKTSANPGSALTASGQLWIEPHSQSPTQADMRFSPQHDYPSDDANMQQQGIAHGKMFESCESSGWDMEGRPSSTYLTSYSPQGNRTTSYDSLCNLDDYDHLYTLVASGLQSNNSGYMYDLNDSNQLYAIMASSVHSGAGVR